MPNTWTLIDSSFPSYTGKERMTDLMPKMLDYMYMLSEGLKYQLNNLNQKNWNSTALEDLKIDTTADLVKQMEAVTKDLSNVINRLNSITAQVSQLEMNVGALEDLTQEHTKQLEELDERTVELEGSMMALEDLILPDGNGGATIGKAGQTLRLVGNIYINGVLLE